MRTELVPETSERFHTPTRLSALCRRESLKTYTLYLHYPFQSVSQLILIIYFPEHNKNVGLCIEEEILSL